MLLRRGDLGKGFKRIKFSQSDSNPYCKALDESDLVATGQAESPLFGLDLGVDAQAVSSDAQVYKTEAQNAASWRRGTSAAGAKCLEVELRQFPPPDFTFVSFRRLAFPRVAPQVAAYRVTWSRKDLKDLPLTLDLVALRNGRAQPHPFSSKGRCSTATLATRRCGSLGSSRVERRPQCSANNRRRRPPEPRVSLLDRTTEASTATRTGSPAKRRSGRASHQSPPRMQS